MEEQIQLHLNYVIIFVKLVINMEFQTIHNIVYLVYLIIDMIILKIILLIVFLKDIFMIWKKKNYMNVIILIQNIISI